MPNSQESLIRSTQLLFFNIFDAHCKWKSHLEFEHIVQSTQAFTVKTDIDIRVAFRNCTMPPTLFWAGLGIPACRRRACAIPADVCNTYVENPFLIEFLTPNSSPKPFCFYYTVWQYIAKVFKVQVEFDRKPHPNTLKLLINYYSLLRLIIIIIFIYQNM